MSKYYLATFCCAMLGKKEITTIGDGNMTTTWHKWNICSDTVDDVAMLSKWMAMHAWIFVSMGQQKCQHSGKKLMNSWPSQTTHRLCRISPDVFNKNLFI